MSLVLFFVGATLVVVGLLWRLSEIEAGAPAGLPLEIPALTAQPPRASASPSSHGAVPLAAANIAVAEVPGEISHSAVAKGFRRSDRVLLKLPLEVSGTDLEGNPFTERTHTLVINRNGASFVLRDSIHPNGPMTIKNLQTGQTCRFQAFDASHALSGGMRECAVECLDPAPNFWGISFAESLATNSVGQETFGALLECSVCHSREMAKLTLAEYRTTVHASLARYCIWCGAETEWKFATIAKDEVAMDPPDPNDGAVEERRREQRRIARLPVSIRHADGREEFTIAENVSRTGLCCAANMELQIGDRVYLRLMSGDGPDESEFRAQIMSRRQLQEKCGILYGMLMRR